LECIHGFGGKLEGKTPQKDPDVSWRTTLKGWVGIDWIHLAQDRDLWWALVNTVQNVDNYRVVERLVDSQEERSPMELVNAALHNMVTMILNNNTKGDSRHVSNAEW
jgi:hypothetical protein